MRLLVIALLLQCAACSGPARVATFAADPGEAPGPGSVVALKSDIYGETDYRLVHVRGAGSGRAVLRLLEDGREIASVALPVPDEEVKNFSLSGIEATAGGFRLTAEWGGGNYFYTRTFDFEFADGAFLLVHVTRRDLRHPDGTESERHETIEPGIPFDEFVPTEFL